MHKFFSMILCITLISVLSACGGGGNTNATSTTSGATKGVTFSFSKQGLAPIASSTKSLSAAGVQTTLDPSAAHAFLTVTDGSGNPSYHTVDIFSINGNYITATIPLTPGTYTLTQFLVLDSNNNVLYLAPTQSAADDIKQLVSTVLPISFTVTKDVTNNTVALQVLAPDPDTTSDEYGYTSIPFSIVNYIKFMSSVQILNTTTNNWELTTANLAVNGVNYSHPPQASTLHVAQADSYTLVFSKTGYETNTITLTAAEIASYQTAPLIVTLIPSVIPSVYHNVTFDSNDGTPVPPPQSIEDGHVATRPPDPTKPGYTFVGWFYDDLITPFDFNTPITADIILYAKWMDWSSVPGVPPQSGVTWLAAFDTINNLNSQNFEGHNDWRLPNVAELQFVYENVGGDYYRFWSSEEIDVDRARCVDFGDGSERSCLKTNVYGVWPVRGQ